MSGWAETDAEDLEAAEADVFRVPDSGFGVSGPKNSILSGFSVMKSFWSW
jgi:hypothetical protein